MMELQRGVINPTGPPPPADPLVHQTIDLTAKHAAMNGDIFIEKTMAGLCSALRHFCFRVLTPADRFAFVSSPQRQRGSVLKANNIVFFMT